MLAAKRQKIVILTGYLGSGKTTLFNKACKANQKVAQGGDSVTLSVFSKLSAYGKGFRVLDTPGLGARSNKLAHACALMCALSEGPVYQILITVKFERTDLMIKQLKPMINGIYQKFKNVVTVVVTNWDLIFVESQEAIQITKEKIISEIKLLNVHQIIFVQVQTTGAEICQQIDQILADQKQQQQKNEKNNKPLTETEFYANFDLIEMSDEIENQLKEAQHQCTRLFRKKKKVIQKFIADYDSEKVNMPSVMHSLTIAIKDYANQVIGQFEKDNNDKFSELFENYNDVNMAYLIDIELKKDLMLEVNQLMDQAQKKMKVSKQHCFNFIKKCPYCHEVWIKVNGCENETNCGDFPTDDHTMFQSQTIPSRYTFKFTDDNVIFNDLGEQNFVVPKQTYKDPGDKRRGCGREIDWKSIPALDPHLVKELLDPGVIDFFALEVQKKELQWRLNFDLDKKIKQQQEATKIEELD